jgi:hypothetical protein
LNPGEDKLFIPYGKNFFLSHFTIDIISLRENGFNDISSTLSTLSSLPMMRTRQATSHHRKGK